MLTRCFTLHVITAFAFKLKCSLEHIHWLIMYNVHVSLDSLYCTDHTCHQVTGLWVTYWNYHHVCISQLKINLSILNYIIFFIYYYDWMISIFTLFCFIILVETMTFWANLFSFTYNYDWMSTCTSKVFPICLWYWKAKQHVVCIGTSIRVHVTWAFYVQLVFLKQTCAFWHPKVLQLEHNCTKYM